jgi:predicted TIM-barrel fold metal-dependent hydrolase
LRFLRHEMFESVLQWTGQEVPPEELSIDLTVAAMDAGEISFGLLSAWHAPEGPLIGNDEVAGWVAQHRDRFAGLAAVNLAKPMAAVRELRRCVEELGFIGLRVVPWLWDAPPTDRRYYPLYSACVELGVPFCTQVGHTGPMRPSETGRPIPYIDQVALDFPELTVVCGHIGYPWTEEMVTVARKHENVFIDTSALTAKRDPPELLRYMTSRIGLRSVMFVTNYPMIPAVAALADLDTLDLYDETRELFLGGYARRVFSLVALEAPPGGG